MVSIPPVPSGENSNSILDLLVPSLFVNCTYDKSKERGTLVLQSFRRMEANGIEQYLYFGEYNVRF